VFFAFALQKINVKTASVAGQTVSTSRYQPPLKNHLPGAMLPFFLLSTSHIWMGTIRLEKIAFHLDYAALYFVIY